MPDVESGVWPAGFLCAAALSLWGLGGCGGPPPCSRASECPAPQVCGLQGRCTPLEAPEGAQFAASEWLYATDWGIAGPSEEPLGDRLRVGGAASEEALLAFGPLPSGGELLRAVLVLRRHETASPRSMPAEVLLESVGPFRGGVLPPRSAVTPDRFAAAHLRLAAGPPRDLRVDVTNAAREAAGEESRTLHLLVRSDDGAPLYFASPQHADEARQPRLELLLY